MRAKGSTHGENLNRAKEGRLLLCEWTNAPLRDEQGRAIGIFSMGQDVTERRREQRELRDAKENLERRVADRTAALETTLRELEAFSYSVSHDLRAPLRAIAGFTRMAIEDEGERLSAEGRRQLSVVEASARRMGDLVDALLSLSRINRATLKRERVNMRALADAVCAELQPQYPATDLDVGDLPPGTGDATLLRQVLANLVGNALKYSARAEMPRVEVGWSDRLEAWTVRDNGVGFDMAYAGKLFGTFERLHSEKEFEGTGIGLAIVKRIVERHGGKVGAEGTPGGGAMFWFSLPAG